MRGATFGSHAHVSVCILENKYRISRAEKQCTLGLGREARKRRVRHRWKLDLGRLIAFFSLFYVWRADWFCSCWELYDQITLGYWARRRDALNLLFHPCILNEHTRPKLRKLPRVLKRCQNIYQWCKYVGIAVREGDIYAQKCTLHSLDSYYIVPSIT